MLQKKENLQKNIIISHNRILEVEKIEEKEIKEGGKISENENYFILDKDYWKSEELMRALLEKKKKLPTWLLAIMVIFGAIMSIVIMVMTYNLIKSYVSPPVVAPITKQIPVIQKEIKVTPINEEKQETIIIQNTEEFEKINADYLALQVEYKKLLDNPTINEIEVIKYEEVVVLRDLSEKEEFIMSLWQNILNKCDKLIIKDIDNKGTLACKNLYAKYILNIK